MPAGGALMAFPPAHFLVGAGVAEMLRVGTPLPRYRAWLLAGALAVSPDLDFVVGLAAGRAAAYHGTFTHSVVAVVVVSLLCALAGRAWGLVGGAGYGSHLIVDLLDDRGRTNVLLGWPVSLNQPDAIARIFPTVPFQQGEGIAGAAASLLEPAVLEKLLQQTLVGVLLCAGLFAWAGALRLLGRVRRK